MPEATPVFSVIVPTHNRPAQLAHCLQALVEIDYPHDRFEVIVVDDGGTAPLQEILNSFRSRLALSFLSQGRKGPAAARNNGVAHAKGNYLAFTDDDCSPLPSWLTMLQKRFEDQPDHLYGGRTLNGLPQNPYAAASQAVIDVVYAWQEESRTIPRFFATNNLAVRTELFRRAGGFRPSFEVSEDREFCDRWAHIGYTLTYAPDVLVYHQHELSLAALWRQHFNYGRGAFRFHKLRAQREWGRFRPEKSYYVSLARSAYLKPPKDRAIFISLLTVVQLANAAGFAWEAIAGSDHRKRDSVHSSAGDLKWNP